MIRMTTHTIPLSSHLAPRHRTGVRRHRPVTSGLPAWSLVSRRHDALLRYARARGVVSLAVHYATWGHRILLRLPAYNDASHFLDGADIALDIDASTVGAERIVRVSGVAVVSAAECEPADATLGPDPAGLPSATVVIVPESVEWLPQVDDVRYPPLPSDVDRMPATFAG